jgi:hypothetical protein
MNWRNVRRVRKGPSRRLLMTATNVAAISSGHAQPSQGCADGTSDPTAFRVAGSKTAGAAAAMRTTVRLAVEAVRE